MALEVRDWTANQNGASQNGANPIDGHAIETRTPSRTALRSAPRVVDPRQTRFGLRVALMLAAPGLLTAGQDLSAPGAAPRGSRSRLGAPEESGDDVPAQSADQPAIPAAGFGKIRVIPPASAVYHRGPATVDRAGVGVLPGRSGLGDRLPVPAPEPSPQLSRRVRTLRSTCR